MLVVAAMGGMFTLAGQWLAARLSRPKDDAEKHRIDAEKERIEADASEKISAAALSLVQPLTDKIEQLEKNLAAQQCTIDTQQSTINDLQATIKAMQLDSAAKDKAFQDVVVRVRVLETALCEAETEIHELTNGANDLADQVAGMGAKPVYIPPPRVKRS